MPSGLGRLTSLQTLSVFVVGKGIGCKLNDLNGLKCLRGKLAIQNLENVKRVEDSVGINLKEKSNLRELKLVWNDQEAEAGREKHHVNVLETLQPHQHLKCLSIHGYKGERFPGWLMKDLPLLTNLVMEEMHDLRFIDVEQTNSERGGSHHQHFPLLEELKLSNFNNLESWATTKEESLAVVLPCLLNLTISDCPKLTSMPLLPSLEKCVLDKCSEKLVHSLMLQQQQQQLISSSPSTSSSSGPTTATSTLKYLNIEACNDLICLSDQVFQGLTGLLELEITNCVSLTTLSGLQHLTSLQTLSLTCCEELHMLEGFDSPTSLQSLLIEKIPKLKSLPEGLQNAATLTKIHISFCEGLVALPECLENLTKLWIVGCWNLMTWPIGLLRNNRMSVVDLALSGCSSLLSLPEELQHLTSLQILGIMFFEDLTSLPEWLGNLTFLKSLGIVGCPNLGSLQCLTSLQWLYISGCDKLTPRCKKNIGEDWPYISHIPNIRVDDVRIQ
ncbi:Disease resistance protein rga2 [Thalictrum thalictroides]|uniref:Disease resistance protein rga2 n=1 Tax=Thalictrum thalictroides TaxID=46969 RepID=A0A7J6VMZ2_THATH|nr:Disease resistance protein rga2 [Thalictrum thalictroides]